MRIRTHGADLRPHSYEIFVALNAVAAYLFIASHGSKALLLNVLSVTWPVAATLASFMAIGIVIRIVLGAIAGTARPYLRQLSRWTWWLESTRLLIMGALAMHIYMHLKIFVLAIAPADADRALWDADYALLFGHSPTVLLLELFSDPGVLRAIDWSYDVVFQSGLYVVFATALSSPSQRIRVAFVGAKSAMWIVGAWLYYTFPSFGPAYRFPQFWDPLAEFMPHTRSLLDALFANYLVVIGRYRGPINVTYGIAAFPSLHVAFHVLVALWARRFSPVAGMAGLAAAVLIFLGSMVTGWHYLVDSIAGVLLAAVFYWAFFNLYGMSRWIRLLKAVRRAQDRSARPRLLARIDRAFSVR